MAVYFGKLGPFQTNHYCLVSAPQTWIIFFFFSPRQARVIVLGEKCLSMLCSTIKHSGFKMSFHHIHAYFFTAQQKCTQLPLLEGSQTIAIPLLVTHPQNITNILYCRIYLFAEDFGSISAPRLYIAIVKTRAAVKTSTFRKHGLLMHTG